MLYYERNLLEGVVMIKQFTPVRNGWPFLSVLLILLLSGCVLTDASSTNGTEVSSHTSTEIPPVPKEERSDQQNDDGIYLVRNPQDEQSGEVSQENVSIGQFRLGNTKRDIRLNMGVNSPDQFYSEPKTGEDVWYYKKHDITFYFYKSSADFPTSGVSRIVIGNQSDLQTNAGVAIGDSVEQITHHYSNLNGNVEEEGKREIWINGGQKGADNLYYPVLRFILQEGKVSQIELSSNGVASGPLQRKPLSYADLRIGDIKIGDTSESLIQRYGEPSSKTTVRGIGDPEWTFKKAGVTVFLEAVWSIRVTSPFKGSTPRGIHIGSTEEEVRVAYPDSELVSGAFNGLVQNSTDHVYQLSFTIVDGKVNAISLNKDLVTANY
jgi:hypothetical protein